MDYNRGNFSTPKSRATTIVLVLLILMLPIAAAIVSIATERTEQDFRKPSAAPIEEIYVGEGGDRVSFSGQHEGGQIKANGKKNDSAGNEFTEFSVTPKSGYTINSISVDGQEVPISVSQGEGQSIRFGVGSGSHSLSATFERIYVHLNMNGGNEESNVAVTYNSLPEAETPYGFTLKKIADTNGPTYSDESKQFYYFSSVSGSSESGLNGGKRYDLGVSYNLPASLSCTLYATYLAPTPNWQDGSRQNIVVPNGVTTISCGADFVGQACNFVNEQYNNTVKNVTLPASAAIISSNAFRNCEALRTVIMSDSTKIIGTAVFSNTGISEFFINEENLFYSVDSQKLLYNKTMTTLYSAPAVGSSDTEIILPSTLKTIEPYAFSSCLSATVNVEEGNTNYTVNEDGLLLSKDRSVLVVCPKGKTGVVQIPSSVTAIAEGALQYCKYVTGFDFGGNDNLTAIDKLTFDGCSLLDSVTLSTKITTIGTSAFRGCTSLTTVTVPTGAQLSSIGNSAFRDCASLTTISSLSGVTSIAEYAFYGCTDLIQITLPQGLSSISAHCFENCTSLVFPTLPNSVNAIGLRSFAGCTSIGATIELPSTLQEIGAEAFFGSTGILSIWIPTSVTELGSAVFAGCNKPTIELEASAVPPGWHDNWNNDLLAEKIIFGVTR